MDDTPNLKLPYIIAAQAQKHVTHNEAIKALDALVQLSVDDRDLAAPPVSPTDGACFIVAASPTGAWTGQAGNVAAWQDGAWAFFAPREGWLAWVRDEDILLAFDGAAWATAGQNVPMIGVNATADATNRLAVKSTASLFDNVGHGHQHKINKAAAGDTASLLFQTGYAGRAEIGTTGDDKLHVKVSADGTTWKETVVVDNSTGYVGIGTSAPANPFHFVSTGTFALERNDDTSGGSGIAIRKSRGTFSSPTAVVAEDAIGSISALGYSGSALLSTTRLRFVVDGTVSSGSVPSRLEFYTFTSGGASTSKLEIKNNGTARPAADNAYLLGDSTNRWSTVYAATGTINTSDERDKDIVGGLPFAGALVDGVDPILFKWKVGGQYEAIDGEVADPDHPEQMIPRVVIRERPGARQHAGWRAQDIKAAMDTAGVDFAAWGLDAASDPDSRQWLRPDQLCAVLWAALRETRAEVAALRASVAGMAPR